MSRATDLPPVADDRAYWLELVWKQANALRFGTVQITIHESRVVQIDTTEKIRFAQSSSMNQPEQSAAGEKPTKRHQPGLPEGS